MRDEVKAQINHIPWAEWVEYVDEQDMLKIRIHN
jgi:hypothetical protein